MPGWRQRREAARSRSPRRESGPLGFGVELTHWLRNWAWGKSYAVDLVRNANTKVAADDGTTCPHIRRLASGTASNAERMVESLVPRERFPQMAHVEDSTVDTLMLPCGAFRWLQKLNPRKCAVHFGTRPEGVSDWWAQPAATEEGRSLWRLHPWLQGKTPADLKYHLPLVLFDDAGPVSKANSSYCRCYSSILGVGSEKESRVVIASGLKVEGIDNS